ncbi:MAG: phage tail sheath subtilisin-like domain-containing protein [Candidatus Marinimicrobia bacterium]|nr:phage tail sheath subtilisin-like domain-containing protein [Candidatus Neomarinimicrobiota bacterium]MCF7880870.1 phage tail sheath subtilisin-like domain-containing protein [Candidatus Neomarinimicrobiota bacterium]
MATYKTPDVYIEEISLFPPSVAEVETAIPAFIGYTDIADELGPNDLRNVPTKVTSMLEYRELFGGPPSRTVNEVNLDENNVVTTYDLESTYLMYDSLRLFFQNGGGKCYIVSIGSYSDPVSKGDFTTGLEKLSKKDEPTIILFPDAVLFESNDLYAVQQQALSQCAELQDRFAVFDLLESKSSDASFDWEAGVDEFRSNIGINNLKYGAAYTPWLKSNLGITLKYRDIQGKVRRGGKTIGLDVLTDSSEVQTTLTNLDNAVSDADTIKSDLDALKSGESTLKAQYTTLLDDFKSDPLTSEFKALFNFIYDMAAAVDEWAGLSGKLDGSSLITDSENMISDTLKDSLSTLIAYDKGAHSELTGNYNLYEAYDPMEASQWDDIFDKTSGNNPDADTSIFVGSTNEEEMLAAEKKITQIFQQVNAAVTELVNAAGNYESTYEEQLYESHSVYQNMLSKLSSALTVLPPSGAIAGVYATVDEARGVWKAPANVSLNSVVGVTEVIDNQTQEDLNVDPTAGKSIDAIRVFTGKGVLVWGARTLAGNSNEWRYISVRRFFNMVEESVKKSTYWAVFEPNDANTWLKVKSMIENYLIQKWRDGALAGAAPDDAFYVKVGLGQTMTSQDILEGRMNVEIGMAVVRPAEFIVLKFSHKMQES